MPISDTIPPISQGSWNSRFGRERKTNIPMKLNITKSDVLKWISSNTIPDDDDTDVS